MQSTTWHTTDPPGWPLYEVSKAVKNRLVTVLGHDLKDRGIPSIGIAPGWMRTELMFTHHPPEELDGPTETPHDAARGVVALAGDLEAGGTPERSWT